MEERGEGGKERNMKRGEKNCLPEDSPVPLPPFRLLSLPPTKETKPPASSQCMVMTDN